LHPVLEISLASGFALEVAGYGWDQAALPKVPGVQESRHWGAAAMASAAQALRWGQQHQLGEPPLEEEQILQRLEALEG
jgi:hypothetical protein